MAAPYYAALVAAWNNATQPPTGVTGTPLTALTTAQKIVAINGWTVTGVIPTNTFFTGSQLINCINWTEFAALTAAQQQNLLLMCASVGNLLGGSSNTAFMPVGMILAYFTNHSGPTVLALTALAQGIVTPWWQAPASPGPGGGLSGPISQPDLTLAGGLT